jgi:DNA end-binding protein Ku
VEAIGDALVLTMMRVSDELADLDDFKFPRAQDIRPAELKMAMQLIDSLSADWKPEKYTDEYRDNLMKVIQAKLKGRRPALQERETAQSADVIDLMARLRASLEGKEGKKGSAAKPRTVAKKAAKTSKRKRHAA